MADMGTLAECPQWQSILDLRRLAASQLFLIGRDRPISDLHTG